VLGTRMACTGSEALVKRRCACRGVPPGEGRGLLQHKSPGQRARGAAPEAPRPIGFGASTCSTARRYRPETRRPADPGADRGAPGGFHGVRTGRPIRDQPERSARSSPATASRLSTRACRLPRLEAIRLYEDGWSLARVGRAPRRHGQDRAASATRTGRHDAGLAGEGEVIPIWLGGIGVPCGCQLVRRQGASFAVVSTTSGTIDSC